MLLFASLVTATCVSAQAPVRLTPAEFGALVERLSEPGGSFDTDNLVSNEDSYLHAITGLERHGVRGGAYLGVGPDQNFSYMAVIRPRIAFIIDIRRDNLLEQLLFKALFHQARNRIDFLALLFGKAAPVDTAGWSARDLEALLGYVTRAPPDSAVAGRAVRARVGGYGIPLSSEDLATIGRFHRTFMAEGPDLRLTTFGRPERFDYPTYRRLLLETDRTGRRASYLARESDFQFVKSLEERNLIVPVVGDLAGPKAVAAIGRYLTERGERVAAFYTSNVEQYLFQQNDEWSRWHRNVATLPLDSSSTFIRSLSQGGGGCGAAFRQQSQWSRSIQLLSSMIEQVKAFQDGRVQYYCDVIRISRQ